MKGLIFVFVFLGVINIVAQEKNFPTDVFCADPASYFKSKKEVERYLHFPSLSELVSNEGVKYRAVETDSCYQYFYDNSFIFSQFLNEAYFHLENGKVIAIWHTICFKLEEADSRRTQITEMLEKDGWIYDQKYEEETSFTNTLDDKIKAYFSEEIKEKEIIFYLGFEIIGCD